MTRRKVALDTLTKRYGPRSRAVRRLLWRHGILRTWRIDGN